MQAHGVGDAVQRWHGWPPEHLTLNFRQPLQDALSFRTDEFPTVGAEGERRVLIFHLDVRLAGTPFAAVMGAVMHSVQPQRKADDECIVVVRE